jgi:hypothetical protein
MQYFARLLTRVHPRNSISTFRDINWFHVPILAKSDGAGLDLVPGQGHRYGLIGGKKVVHSFWIQK